MINPKISIIIPAYNSVSTLTATVRSVQAQTFIDWEMIIADNASTDGTLALAESLATEDSRIRVIDVPEKGVYNARNAALNIAQGTYVCFVDSDDTTEPEYLEQLYGANEYDFVVCGYNHVYYKKHDLDTPHFIKQYIPKSLDWDKTQSYENLIDLFGFGFVNICCNKLLRNDIIQNNNIRFHHYPSNEDFIFMLEYLKYARSIKVLDKPLYNWIKVEDHLTAVGKLSDYLLDAQYYSHKMLRQFFNTNPSLADIIYYHQYELIIYKYYEAYYKKRITLSEMFKKAYQIMSNEYVHSAMKAYNPTTKGEKVFNFLMRHKLMITHYILTQKILTPGWKSYYR